MCVKTREEKPLSKNEIYILAGPNGAGKTTFANSFIPSTPTIQQFVNADLIAYGLSPFAPEKEAIQAGKLMLKQIDKLVTAQQSFCIETTLAGKGYARQIPLWQSKGYHITLIFLTLPDAETAIARVARRVQQGGHHIPEDVIRRRFSAGLKNFENLYKDLVDHWALYDNAGQRPILLQAGDTNANKHQR